MTDQELQELKIAAKEAAAKYRSTLTPNGKVYNYELYTSTTIEEAFVAGCLHQQSLPRNAITACLESFAAGFNTLQAQLIQLNQTP